jgi:hypothetical protein
MTEIIINYDFLSTPKSDESLSLSSHKKKKKLKIREMKCGIKIEFLTTKGIYDLLITKKDGELK